MKTIVDSLKVLGESTRMFESLRDNLFAPKGLKFNSQICTTRVQSERLLALGLKKETADMMWWSHTVDWCGIINETERQWHLGIGYAEPLDARMERIPAWSLHRLIEMADTTTYINEGREDENELWFCMDKCYCWNNHESFYSMNLYDSLINCLEWLIKEGYFNKEYLEE